MKKVVFCGIILSVSLVVLSACRGRVPVKPLAEISPTATTQPTAAATTGPAVPATPDDADSNSDSGEESVASEQSFAGTVPAPEFPVGLDWLNSARPLALAELRGKVVLLDFWTYGCINCMHVIPDLKRLESKYADELVVIGVHSAKFANEGETENIRRIILRYELEHPVINDKDFIVWTQFGAQAWPTFVLIDPDGNVVGFHSGEGIYDLFDYVIGSLVNEFEANGRLDRTPLELALERRNLADSPLLFPGKVLADEANNRLFIADSNHNRIVITDLAGNVLEVIGSGRAALQDGDYQTAAFFRPQGLTLAGDDTLYVADTENHALRRVDLAARLVETVAGTGQQVYLQQMSGPALDLGLNSPWDVLTVDGLVYIAMAGQHQVWVYDPTTSLLRRHAGSGREELEDGALAAGGLNQPSGLATDGERLYVADSEASAIRSAALDPGGRLETIVGTGLFDFGDVDGRGDEVRLQHPLGVAYLDSLLYVADTYNSKIKVIDPETRESVTFLGGETAGWRDGADALFDEPGGLSITRDKLYIADTNNHVIRVADLATRQVSTLVLVDMDGLLTRRPDGETFVGKVVTLEPQMVAAGAGAVQVEVEVPAGYKLNDLAPFAMSWQREGTAVQFDLAQANQTVVKPHFPLTFPATFTEGQATLRGDLVIYYCQTEAQALCLIEQVRLLAPVRVAAGGGETLSVTYTIPLPTVIGD
ncbi:MAG: thioredoxin-like domain-containing protein [Chloroflexota bacterium]